MNGYKYVYGILTIYVFISVIILHSNTRNKKLLWNDHACFSSIMLSGERYQDCRTLTNISAPVSYQTEWQNVTDDGTAYVYSAYTIGNVVKMIGAAERKHFLAFCQLWSRQGGGSLSLSAVHEANIVYLPEAHNKRYVPCYFLCPFFTPDRPSGVSVVLTDPCAKPHHMIQIPSSSRSPRRKFTVCVSPMFGSAKEQLIDWIEMNRILGAEYFVFYNYSILEIDDKILSHYSKRGLAEVNSWNLPIKEMSIHYNAQMAAINDCILRHKDNTDFVAIFDLDEFIVPRNNSDFTWHDMMKRLPNASSLIFQTALFPLQWRNAKKNNGFMQYKLDIFSKLTREAYIPDHRSKIIANPRAIDILGIHCVHVHMEGHSVAVPTDIGLVHHYREGKYTGRIPKNVTDTTVLKYRDQMFKNTRRVRQDIMGEQ